MRLATFVAAGGAPRIGVVQDGRVLELAAAHRGLGRGDEPAFADMLALIDAGERGLDLARDVASRADIAEHGNDLASVRLLSPVPVPRQMRDFSVFETHIRQAGAAIQRMRGKAVDAATVKIPQVYRDQPIYYKGNRFSVVGHNADVVWPSYSRQLDFELEFGIFIGRTGRDIPAPRAAEHIFGYTIFNDVSARDAQSAEMAGLLGPGKGKDFDTGNVIGPWIVTPDELGDPYDLTMAVRVNGEVWARGHSRDMLHGFEDMIAWVSRDETLYAGEFLGSGTVGNGCGIELDRWIKPGDVIELDVERIGTLRNRVVASGTAADPASRA